jgi:hypothetical protein
MPSNNRYRTATSAAKYASKFANHSAKYASKAIIGLARWATTDHTGSAKFLANIPSMGFFNTITMLLAHLLFGMLGAVVSGFLMFLLIAYGIPALLFL